MEKTKININGMHCQGCVSNLTKMLKAIPGVTEVDVSLQNKHANIAYDPAAVTIERFVSTIENAGFDVVA